MVPQKTYKYFPFYLALILVSRTLLSILFIYYQGMNLDEGNYIYTAQLFFQGQKPYQDFFFDKFPLLLVVFGLPQKFIASGIFWGRWYCFIYSFIALIILIYLAYRLGGQRAALVCTLLMSRHFLVMGGCGVSTYPASWLFFSLSLFFIFSSLKPSIRWFWAFFTLSLAVQIRHIYLPAALLYLALASGERKLAFKKLAIISFFAFLLSSLWLIPIFYQTFNNAYNNLFNLYTSAPYSELSPWQAFLKAKSYWFFASLQDFFPELVTGLICFILYIKTFPKRFWQHPQTFLASLILLLIGVSLKVNYSYSGHNLIAVPAMVLLLSLSISSLLAKYKKFEVLGWLGLIALILFNSLPPLKYYAQRSNSTYKDVKTISRIIINNTQPKELIIAFDSEQLAETGRQTLTGMNYSTMGMLFNYSDRRCQELHLMNLNLLLTDIKTKKAKLIEISDSRLSELSSIFGEKATDQILDTIKKNYLLLTFYLDGNFPRHYCYFFIRKETANNIDAKAHLQQSKSRKIS